MLSPIARASIQAAVLAATSNILAQALSSWRNSSPFTLNTTPILHFILFALLSTPPNFLWQDFLEREFPGKVSLPPPTKPAAPDTASASPRPGSSSDHRARTSVRNILVKFALDQTLGAVVNTVVFVGGMGALRGLSHEQIVAAIRTDTVPLIVAGLKLWPLVSLLNFTVVPPRQRLMFGNLVGVAWGVFLSLFEGGR